MGFTIRPVAAKGLSLVPVPDEVAKDLEDLYTFLTENPGQVALASFDTADEVKTFERQAKSWAASREAGVLEYRRLPYKDGADTDLKFNIRPPLTDEQKAENARKNAERKAKAEAAAKKSGK